MDLYLRKVSHSQAYENYRAGDGESNTIIPTRSFESEGDGKDRADCMAKFKAAWEMFASDEANLTNFLDSKRRACR